MRDAYGGIVSIAIVVVFLVLVSGYLAFNVNYTKAFRLKNKIISVLEEHEVYNNIVSDGCSKNMNNAICRPIGEYASQIGYNVASITPPNDGGQWKCDKGVGFCVKLVDDSSDGNKKHGFYYEVVTQININIPIINNIMGLRIFQIKGATRTMYK